MFQWLKSLFTSNKKSKPAKLWESGAGPKIILSKIQASDAFTLKSVHKAVTDAKRASASKSYASSYRGQPSTYSNPATNTSRRDEEDLPLSMAIGAATGSSLAGYAVGGSLVGGMLGQSVHDSTTRRDESSCTPSYDSPSYSSSSYDSGSSSSYSSCDSSSSSSSSSSPDW
jgi:hypothetical protein